MVAGLRRHPKFHLRKLIPSIASYLHEISSSSVTRVQDRVPTRRRPVPGSLGSGPSAGTPVGGGDRRAPIETQKDHARLQPPWDFALSLASSSSVRRNTFLAPAGFQPGLPAPHCQLAGQVTPVGTVPGIIRCLAAPGTPCTKLQQPPDPTTNPTSGCCRVSPPGGITPAENPTHSESPCTFSRWLTTAFHISGPVGSQCREPQSG